MAIRFRLPRPSFAFFLQATACLVVAWSLWSGGLTGPQTPDAEQPPGTSAPDGARINSFKEGVIDRSGTAASATTATPTVPVADPATAVTSIGAAASFQGAQLALSSIDVIVSRNDTLD